MNKSRIYFIGIGWFILSLFSSVLNDVISKYTGGRLHFFEVAFFRFTFGALSLVPFILYYGAHMLKTANPFVHVTRGVTLFFAMTTWTYGLTVVPMVTTTLISLAIPLFFLVLALFFLKEKIMWQRWVATTVGFVGIAITLQPHSEDFNPEVLILIVAAISFASLDIINKKFVVKESMISMLFYSAIITALLSVQPAVFYWQTPTWHELGLLAILGMSGNLILFFILKAFALVDATAVAPYRYLELVMSAICGYCIFGDIPTSSALYGAAIIIPATLFIVYSENRAIKKSEAVV